MIQCNTHIPVLFLSTPSARRATFALCQAGLISKISIHALREEGDGQRSKGANMSSWISIHALREEGDKIVGMAFGSGGVFLSTPSARRATHS